MKEIRKSGQAIEHGKSPPISRFSLNSCDSLTSGMRVRQRRSRGSAGTRSNASIAPTSLAICETMQANG